MEIGYCHGKEGDPCYIELKSGSSKVGPAC